jgi:hypothetical protein
LHEHVGYFPAAAPGSGRPPGPRRRDGFRPAVCGRHLGGLGAEPGQLQTGTAAGLLRTFTYLGAIASAGITGFAFGARATDAGLHHLGVILTIASAVLLAATLADRDLHHRVATSGQGRTEAAPRQPRQPQLAR